MIFMSTQLLDTRAEHSSHFEASLVGFSSEIIRERTGLEDGSSFIFCRS